MQLGLPNTRCLKAAKRALLSQVTGSEQAFGSISALGSQELPLSPGFASTALSSLLGFSSVHARELTGQAGMTLPVEGT